jgi:hypothetical protein
VVVFVFESSFWAIGNFFSLEPNDPPPDPAMVPLPTDDSEVVPPFPLLDFFLFFFFDFELLDPPPRELGRGIY